MGIDTLDKLPPEAMEEAEKMEKEKKELKEIDHEKINKMFSQVEELMTKIKKEGWPRNTGEKGKSVIYDRDNYYFSVDEGKGYKEFNIHFYDNDKRSAEVYMHAYIDQNEPKNNKYVITVPSATKPHNETMLLSDNTKEDWLIKNKNNLSKLVDSYSLNISDKETLNSPDEIQKAIIDDTYKRLQDGIGTIEHMREKVNKMNK